MVLTLMMRSGLEIKMAAVKKKQKWNGVPPRYWDCYKNETKEERKERLRIYHLSCPNWPNCDIEGCGRDGGGIPGYRD